MGAEGLSTQLGSITLLKADVLSEPEPGGGLEVPAKLGPGAWEEAGAG